jgi:Ca2+-binding EF-hand superfamily protein
MRGVGMTSEDAGVLFSILDDSKRGSEVIDYNMLTAAMFPPMPDDAMRGDEVTRESRSRQMIRDRSLKKDTVKELGPGEVKKFLMNLTPEQIMRVLRNKVNVTMRNGPGALFKWFEVFDSDGEKQITREELKELLVDFGLYLRDDQISGVMALFGSEGGTCDQSEFVSSLLPVKQYSLTASEYELHDKESVGHVPGEGKLSGEDLKTFLKDKLMREFAKKGESAPGRQIREALARFDARKDGSMTTYELRKAFQSMGLFASNDTVETLVGCYDKVSLWCSSEESVRFYGLAFALMATTSKVGC